ncbi:MAG: GNAT family N-acetyltransferase [Longimicrobiales bacterium]
MQPRIPLPVLDVPANPALEPARRGYRDRVLFVYPAGATYALRHAQPADAPAIHAQLETYVAEGRVLPRTLDQVYRSIRDFIVAVDGERIVGCGALRIYTDTLAEIGALAVVRDWHGRGVGGRIVEALKLEARILAIQRVFALTLEDRFFHKLGFRSVTIDEFPEKIARDCASCARRAGCIEIAVVHEVAYDVQYTRRA